MSDFSNRVLGLAGLLTGILLTAFVGASEWAIPTGANSFRTAPSPSGDGFLQSGAIAWSSTEDVYSIYFYVDRAATVELSLTASSPDGTSVLEAACNDLQAQVAIDSSEVRSYPIGTVTLAESGYVRVDLRGIERDGEIFAEIFELRVTSQTEGLVLNFVETLGDGFSFWGRSGPSVHLLFSAPAEPKIRYAFAEITIAAESVYPGAVILALGSQSGYVHFRVDLDGSRFIHLRVINQNQTAGSGSEPDSERVKIIYSPPGSQSSQIENQYYGGQIMFDFDWQPGKTYQVLSEVFPDGQGNTNYNMWIRGAPEEEWTLICRMQRPKFETHLDAAHCYLLNTFPPYGYLERSATFGNIWYIDVDGIWHESLEAILSCDATANADYRLDFEGGVIDSKFFLRHCGFFTGSNLKRDVFRRSSTLSQQPTINFDALPRGD